MSARVAFGLLVSLASACVINLGFFVQHRAAAGLPELKLRHPIATLIPLLKDRAWVIGNLAGVLGWLLYLLALWPAPLSLVQAASAGGVGAQLTPDGNDVVILAKIIQIHLHASRKSSF